MSGYISTNNWKCPGCLLTRYPNEEIIKDKDKLYLLRVCRVCKYQDIELIEKSKEDNPPDVKPPKRNNRFKLKFPEDYFTFE